MMKEIEELEKSYIVLMPGQEQKVDLFALQMLQENRIRGLLVFEKRVFNGEEKFYYDVSGKQSMAEEPSELSLSGAEIRMLLQSLHCLITELHSYFLDIKGILLQFEYIFREEGEYFFCYNPSFGKEETDRNWAGFAESLLGYTNHDDDLAVLLSYEFYRKSKEKKSILQILEEVLSLSLEPEEEEIPVADEGDFLIGISAEEESGEQKKSFDMITFSIFAIWFLVSISYLLFLFYSGENIKFSETAGTPNGRTALIFLGLSILGMLACNVPRIDIKEKK